MSTKGHDAEKDEGNPMVRFRATPAFVKRLDRVAKSKAVKRADIVRQALMEFFERVEAA